MGLCASDAHLPARAHREKAESKEEDLRRACARTMRDFSSVSRQAPSGTAATCAAPGSTALNWLRYGNGMPASLPAQAQLLACEPPTNGHSMHTTHLKDAKRYVGRRGRRHTHLMLLPSVSFIGGMTRGLGACIESNKCAS